MKLLDGKKVSAEIKEELKSKIREEKERSGRVPGLGIIQIGHNEAASVYVQSQLKGSRALGMESYLYSFDDSVEEETVLKKIKELNQTEEIDGIILQLPLPKHISHSHILQAIDVNKDVDGFKTENIGRLHLGEEGFNPCTPEGVIALLKKYDIEIASKNVTIIGRSNIVGKPMFGLFINHNATVTICNSLTKNLKEHTERADIIVVAVGKEKFLTADMVREGAIVIDVGINRSREGKIVGDVDFEAVAPKASYITPVPGGVGSMTVAMLFQNIWKAFIRNRRIINGEKNKGE
ncbi:tetrahydrofolate dehydrogenase/cyclohydrolase, NAD(P)-binding domain protein [Fusobacterium necrophorum subsp. funduliforme ATCC 51357]|uniref:bifunctional 5,10-methylenetetrahydrofolate dehydrogenase/5,10-methenyltetrahydrofolate cyclohydrolase n=1 Tax=Fusobacterium necrophorum TaxID=859 RepID=UPI00025E5E24|nr:bifunctional 5,10-methylenetetrahydrofolate dehydrogenase/5,10-methenyltetrahydrofolate cyclohydrolase [Fusobacterium necrophorum]EIJ70384.1 tetrahydrofolate dehydrogenase/cyclohydrolase, NAD(P)-binding domain protein [Fusobacterium necrophorum subsp. funduliforme ATCC 51357]KAB0552034.1 bifunctional 5,10-methylenetetrahydrofolate dehydrogenase/5,10-methenyltetrahydrofolate cyclohydrolase [Fusobacterium necrophorum subsp. funduliforme]